MRILLRIWNWFRHFWRRRRVAKFVSKDYSVDIPLSVEDVKAPPVKARAVGFTLVPDVEPEDKAPMVRCFFCHRRTRLGRPCCNWRYLAIVAASLHIGGRRNPRRGFTDRTSGHARASGQRRFSSRMANRRRMRERSIKVNRGLL
jgi:hypothetical protein